MTGLRLLMEKLEVKEGDTCKKAFLKGAAEGAIEGLVIVGALGVVQGLTGIKLLDVRRKG